MKPSIGRIVIYRTSQGLDVPAIVTAVPGVEDHPTPPDEGCVHLRCFYPGGLAEDFQLFAGVPGPADEPGHWRWPERDQ